MSTELKPHTLAGQHVEHKSYGWRGTVAPYAHTKKELMIIWELGSSRGAGLADKKVLTLLPTQTTLLP